MLTPRNGGKAIPPILLALSPERSDTDGVLQVYAVRTYDSAHRGFPLGTSACEVRTAKHDNREVDR
jgi:hypothetical protein